MHICFPGETGLPYRIEASEDLLHWIPVGDVVSEAGKVQFTEPDASLRRQWFFRMRPIAMEALGVGE
jgi:hypothetical protein